MFTYYYIENFIIKLLFVLWWNLVSKVCEKVSELSCEKFGVFSKVIKFDCRTALYIYIYNLIRELNVLYLSFFQVIMFLHTLLVPTTITIRAFFIIYIVKARVCNKNESIF